MRRKNRKADTIAMSPDAVNEMLNGDRYDYSCSEEAEGLLKAEVMKIARMLSPEDMKSFIVMFSLPLEDELRENHPGHPALPFLDEYHEEQRLAGGSDSAPSS